MDIQRFISNFTNHPILFIGTGISLRYLNNTYTWENLLKHISYELTQNHEVYFDIKSDCYVNNEPRFDKIASALESNFNRELKANRNGKFKEINDTYYLNMNKGVNSSRFKLYLADILGNLKFKEDKMDEIQALKKSRKNIGSIVTTNYDKLVEEIFEFNPLIGNDILLSNPYGSVYKIHGCITDPEKIIITCNDYEKFEEKYELIRAQLLSLFIHNPIIFLGYSMGDKNIKDILKTIYTYIQPNSDEAEKIRSNFLLVEYEENSDNLEVIEHDIVIGEHQTIRINKIKTDNYKVIYESLANLQLPVSAMDVRKVQSVVKEIYAGGKIQVNITEDLNQLDNKDKVLVIGSANTIKYEFQTVAEMMINYFEIIEEENSQLLSLIDKMKIQSNQYFPMMGFYRINPNLKSAGKLIQQQKEKVENIVSKSSSICKNEFNSLQDILKDEKITQSNEVNTIIHSILNSEISLEEVESYLKSFEDKMSTDYKKVLCAYDLKLYS